MCQGARQLPQGPADARACRQLGCCGCPGQWGLRGGGGGCAMGCAGSRGGLQENSVVRGAGISTPEGSRPPAPALSIASRTAYPNADVIGPGGLGFLTPVVRGQAGWDGMVVGMERCCSPGSHSHTHTHTHTHTCRAAVGRLSHTHTHAHVQSCRGPPLTHTHAELPWAPGHPHLWLVTSGLCSRTSLQPARQCLRTEGTQHPRRVPRGPLGVLRESRA